MAKIKRASPASPGHGSLPDLMTRTSAAEIANMTGGNAVICQAGLLEDWVVAVRAVSEERSDAAWPGLDMVAADDWPKNGENSVRI